MADNRAQFTLDINSREGINALRLFADAAERAAKKGKDVEDSAAGIGRGLGAMAASFGGNVLANVASSAVSAAEDFTRSSLKLTVARDTMAKSFEALLGDARKAEQAMDLIRKASTRPGLTFDSAASGVAGFLGTNENLEMSVRLVTAFGNAAALSGTSVDEMAEAMRQWRQVLGRGKAEQEEVNGLLERFPSLGEQLVVQFGGRTAEAINKSSKSVADMQNKFAAAMEGMKTAPDGLANALLVLDDNYKQLQEEFGKGLIGNESKERVGKLSKALQDLKPVAKDVGGYIGKTLTDAVRLATDAWSLWKAAAPKPGPDAPGSAWARWWKEQWSWKPYQTWGEIAEQGRQREAQRGGGFGALRSIESTMPSIIATPSGQSTLAGAAGGGKSKADTEAEKQKAAKQARDEVTYLKAESKFWEQQNIGQKRDAMGLLYTPVNPFTARLLAAEDRAAKLGGPVDAAQLKAQRAVEANDTEQKRLDDLITELEVARDEFALGAPSRAAKHGGINAVEARLGVAKMNRARLDGPAAEARAELEALKASKQERQKIAQQRTANAEAMVSYAAEEARLAEQSGASYQERAAAIQRQLAAQEKVIDLKLREAEIDGDGLALSTARVEAETERMKARREAADAILRAGSDTLGRQASIAGLRGQLAATPAEEAAWEDKRLEFLRQQAGLIAGVASEQERYLGILLEIKRIEDDRAGKLTRGQELLQATLGGKSGVARFIARQGGSFGLVSDDGPQFDWARLQGEKPFRGDAPVGGMAGVLAGAAEGGIRDAAPAIYDAVRGAIGGTMANVVRGVGVG